MPIGLQYRTPNMCQNMSDEPGLRGRVTRQSEEVIGKLAQELLENPLVSGALSAAFEARERASRAQEVAMGALNLPSASDLERLTRRIRGVSQRLEGIEDALDRLEERVDGASGATTLDARLGAIEQALTRIEGALAGSPSEAMAGSSSEQITDSPSGPVARSS